MIAEILSRSFLVQQIPFVKEAFARLAADPSLGARLAEAEAVSELPRVPELEASDYEWALACAEAVEEAGVLGLPEPEGDGEAGTPIDEVSFFSREPFTSLLQSALELFIETRRRDIVEGDDKLPAGDCPTEEDPLAPVTGRRLVGPFEPTDLGWIAFIIAWGLRRWRHRRSFNPDPAPPVTIGDDARVLVVGDWGTGIERAQAIACQMRKLVQEGIEKGIEQHVIHLGDVYYAGWEWEYQQRFLPYWPVKPGEEQMVSSWSLNGNHDMYSGGYGYFDQLLADPRFGRQAKSSWFRLENRNWRLFGLDTAWDETELIDPRTDHGLQDPQAKRVADEIAADGRKVMLLTHHQLFSNYDGVGPYLGMRLKDLIERDRITGWLWGHEHKGIAYAPYSHVEFGRCLGHGGVPVYRVPAPSTGKGRPAVQWVEQHYRSERRHDWALFGFAVLEFAGPRVRVRYLDEYGKQPWGEEIV